MDAQHSEADGRDESEQASDNRLPHSPTGNEEGVDRVTSGQPSHSERTNHTDYDKGGIPRKWEIGIAAFLAFVNCAALVIYSYQLTEMRKATKAATDGLTLTRKMNRLDQRAWVAPGNVFSKPELDKPYRITVVATNTGKTPATDVVARLGTLVKGLADPDPHFGQLLNTTSIPSGSLLAPNGATNMVFPMFDEKRLTQADLDHLTNPAVIHLIFGRVEYDDIFECHHWTSFCYKILPDGTLERYGEYNKADPNKSDYP
jgi:hypothetical protein